MATKKVTTKKTTSNTTKPKATAKPTKVSTTKTTTKTTSPKTAPKTTPKTTKPAKTNLAAPIFGAIIAAILIIAIVIIATVIVDQIMKNDRTGTYEISQITENGEDKADSLSLLKALGLKGVITFNKDKTCHYDVLGNNYDCTYNDTEIINNENGNAINYTFENKTITIKQDNNVLTFTRNN